MHVTRDEFKFGCIYILYGHCMAVLKNLIDLLWHRCVQISYYVDVFKFHIIIVWVCSNLYFHHLLCSNFIVSSLGFVHISHFHYVVFILSWCCVHISYLYMFYVQISYCHSVNDLNNRCVTVLYFSIKVFKYKLSLYGWAQVHLKDVWMCSKFVLWSMKVCILYIVILWVFSKIYPMDLQIWRKKNLSWISLDEFDLGPIA